MGRTDSPTTQYVCSDVVGARHAILIDPADQTPDMGGKRCLAAVMSSSMVLVGGSSGTDMDNVHETVVAIQEALELVTWASTQDAGHDAEPQKIPVILFPQGRGALTGDGRDHIHDAHEQHKLSFPN